MTTAKSSAAASPAAENGGRTTTSRKATAKAAKAAPTVHAVPVDHQDKPGKPMNPKSLPVRPGEDPWTKAEINEVKQALRGRDAIQLMSDRRTSNATRRCRWPTTPGRCSTSPGSPYDTSSSVPMAAAITVASRSARVGCKLFRVPHCVSRASSARNGDNFTQRYRPQ
jgi:hypothetical protein